MTEKKISGPHKTLKTAVYTALAGLGLMVLSLVVGAAISKGSSIPATVMYAMGVIGVILGAGGLLYAAVQLRLRQVPDGRRQTARLCSAFLPRLRKIAG